jgi:hypothetical protein
MAYMSEAAKVRDLPEVMKYITGEVLDVACGGDKIIPSAIGFDGRALPGVDIIGNHGDIWEKIRHFRKDNHFFDVFDTIFSSHFLEHCSDQYGTINQWMMMVKKGGNLILYLPDGDHYDNKANPEHMVDMKYEPFMFWIRRAFCGEGKDFKGDNMPKFFDLVDHALDIGPDRYSFYVILRKV